MWDLTSLYQAQFLETMVINGHMNTHISYIPKTILNVYCYTYPFLLNITKTYQKDVFSFWFFHLFIYVFYELHKNISVINLIKFSVFISNTIRLCMKVSLLWTKLLISLQGDVSIGTNRIRDHTKGYTWKSYIRKVLGNTGTLHKLCRQPVPTKGLFQMSQWSLLIAKNAYLAGSTKMVLPM